MLHSAVRCVILFSNRRGRPALWTGARTYNFIGRHELLLLLFTAATLLEKERLRVRKRLAKLLADIAGASVIVVGDVMLDEYIIGDSERISPEAPEPIIIEQERRYMPGGAANVAVNITALGARAYLVSIVGDDREGAQFREVLRSAGVDDGGIMTVPGRPTTRKTRLIARGNQVLRVDCEMTEPVGAALERRLLDTIFARPEQVVVVSDYAKGMVTTGLMNGLVESGKQVIVDPKSQDLGKYARAYIVTPNLSELSAAAGTGKLNYADIEAHVRNLMERFGIENILVTLGPDGMMLIEQDSPMNHIHARAREVYDVTGAGDTVIATIAAAIAGGTSLADACSIANIAAGIVVGKHRTASTTPDEIMAYVFGPSSSDKIVDVDTLLPLLDEFRRVDRRIVFTNGCFDLLHVGHITYLNEARDLGDMLVVGLNTDRSVRALKGPERPIIPEEERSHLLAALECVDYVVLFDEDTPVDLITKIRPDILVKGGDYTRNQVVGHEIVESYGGNVHLIPVIDNVSTSTIINRIRERNG